MEKISEITVGVDIAKAVLDAHHLPDRASRHFPNTFSSRKAVIAWAGHAVTRTVFEPTALCRAANERMLARAGLPIVKVNRRRH